MAGKTLDRIGLEMRARTAAADLHGDLGATLRAIWPASQNVEMTWPRWATRADVDELERRGLIDKNDFTPLGREVLRVLAAARQCAQSQSGPDKEASND